MGIEFYEICHPAPTRKACLAMDPMRDPKGRGKRQKTSEFELKAELLKEAYMSEELELLRELKEEARNAQLQALWERFGKQVIILVVGSIGIAAAVTLWQWIKQGEYTTATAALSAGVTQLESGKAAEAAGAFAALAPTSEGGVAALAKLKEAESYAKQSQWQKAYDSYLTLARDGAKDIALRDLAAIQASVLMLNHPDITPAAESGLAQAAGADRPFSLLAREMQGLSFLAAGDAVQARTQFSALAEDAKTSTTMRQRVKEYLAALPKTPQP